MTVEFDELAVQKKFDRQIVAPSDDQEHDHGRFLGHGTKSSALDIKALDEGGRGQEGGGGEGEDTGES